MVYNWQRPDWPDFKYKLEAKVNCRVLEEGPKGFEGGMSAKKYLSITPTSKATSTRDLQDLVEKKAFIPFCRGRSTRYAVNLRQEKRDF